MSELEYVHVFIHNTLKIYLQSHLELVPDGVELKIVDLIVDHVSILLPNEMKHEIENHAVTFHGKLGITEHRAIYNITFIGRKITNVKLS